MRKVSTRSHPTRTPGSCPMAAGARPTWGWCAAAIRPCSSTPAGTCTSRARCCATPSRCCARRPSRGSSTPMPMATTAGATSSSPTCPSWPRAPASIRCTTTHPASCARCSGALSCFAACPPPASMAWGATWATCCAPIASVPRLVGRGPAHTDGDCIVLLPQRGVVFTGDILFVGVAPVAWAGPVSRIVEALGRVLALAPRVIVPGHGPLADAHDVQAQIGYCTWVLASLEPLARPGLPPEQAGPRPLDGDGFRSQPFANWLAPERLFTSACTLYREWGLPTASLPGPLGALDHFRRQARLILKT